MSLGPWLGGRLYDASGSYSWLFIGSSAIGLGAVAIALTFRPPRTIPAALAEPARGRLGACRSIEKRPGDAGGAPSRPGGLGGPVEAPHETKR